jgi:starch synthase
VALLTREFPPEVYGGAGVHVEHLAAALAPLVDVGVHCFGGPRDSPLVAGNYTPWAALEGEKTDADAYVLEVLSVDLLMAKAAAGADVVHSHTWYAGLGGHLAKLLHGIPHVATCHSLEPLRPWKAEQLGGGYVVSTWSERVALESADALIAVSGAMREDVLRVYPAIAADRVHVIHNGIDADEYQPDARTDALDMHGIDVDRPYVLFLGRISRQKGILELLEAAPAFDRRAQLVLCAGAPDTNDIAVAARGAVDRARAAGVDVVWIEEMIPRRAAVQLLSHAAVFVCPSVYEPFGLINLEAMACETAVVATRVGGIPEVVVDGETGWLVEPGDAAAMAARVNALLADPALAAQFGRSGRERVIRDFSWPAIAARTTELYASVVAASA